MSFRLGFFLLSSQALARKLLVKTDFVDFYFRHAAVRGLDHHKEQWLGREPDKIMQFQHSLKLGMVFRLTGAAESFPNLFTGKTAQEQYLGRPKFLAQDSPIELVLEKMPGA